MFPFVYNILHGFEAFILLMLCYEKHFDKTVNSWLSGLVKKERMREWLKNMDYPEYFISCIHSSPQINLQFFYTIGIILRRSFFMIASFCELFGLLVTVMQIVYSVQEHFLHPILVLHDDNHQYPTQHNRNET